jgi:hypothetical protein
MYVCPVSGGLSSTENCQQTFLSTAISLVMLGHMGEGVAKCVPVGSPQLLFKLR